jgi:hypothetical protein
MTSEPDPQTPGGDGAGSGPAPTWSPPPSQPSGSPPVNRGGMIIGAILVVLGLLFLAERVVGFDLGEYGWPLFIIVPGVLVFLSSFAAPPREGSGLAVAGAITTTVGLVLAVQNVTGLYATWAYAWALVGPAATGLGLLLYGLVRGLPDLVSAGAKSLGTGLALFVGFGLFFEGVIGLSGDPFLVGSDYLPIVLIAAGGVLLVWSLLRSRRT